MKSCQRSANLRRYRNLPMDVVLALLTESRDEDYFVTAHTRRERHSQ